jgi:hypothetical protein
MDAASLTSAEKSARDLAIESISGESLLAHVLRDIVVIVA